MTQMRRSLLFYYYQMVSIFNSHTRTHIEIDTCTQTHFINTLEWHPSDLKFPGGSTRLEYEYEYEIIQ